MMVALYDAIEKIHHPFPKDRGVKNMLLAMVQRLNAAYT